MEAQLTSNGSRYSTLPRCYVRPEHDRPRASESTDYQNTPVIDLGCGDSKYIAQQIAAACKDYGFFQVIYHGVAKETVDGMLEVAGEFFGLPVEEKMKLYSNGPSKTTRLSTSSNPLKEKIHNWRDYLRLHCYPLQKYAHEWPSNPPSFKIRSESIAKLREDYKLDEESMQIVLKFKHTWEEIGEYWTLRTRVQDLQLDLIRRINSFRDSRNLTATIKEMLDNGFFKSYDELYSELFDRPSQAIKVDNLHSYGEGSCSYSETPHVSNDGSAADWEPTRIRASGVNDPVLKNKVSIDDILEYGKNTFYDISDGHINAFDYQRIEPIMAVSSSNLHSKAPDDISGGSNGLHADGINSPPGQLVPAVVNQEKWKEYNGGKLDREKGLAHTQNRIPHSYGEGSSSHSKAPRDLSSDSLVLDRELRALGFDDPALKNKVLTDILEYGKNTFDDSDGSYQQMKGLISAGSNGLLVDGINSPPGQFVSLHIPSVVNQPQRQEYLGGELDSEKWGCISGGSNRIRDEGINSPLGQHVSIDIPSFVYHQWKEYIGNELDRNKRNYSLITKSTLAITAPAAGTLLNTAISGSSHTSWIGNFVAVATVIGFAFTLASIGLRRVKPMLSGIMTKLGAVSTASAIILALGLTVLPAVAWTAGAVACLLIAIGVAMA